jgi:hypothetical protein
MTASTHLQCKPMWLVSWHPIVQAKRSKHTRLQKADGSAPGGTQDSSGTSNRPPSQRRQHQTNCAPSDAAVAATQQGEVTGNGRELAALDTMHSQSHGRLLQLQTCQLRYQLLVHRLSRQAASRRQLGELCLGLVSGQLNSDPSVWRAWKPRQAAIRHCLQLRVQ